MASDLKVKVREAGRCTKCRGKRSVPVRYAIDPAAQRRKCDQCNGSGFKVTAPAVARALETAKGEMDRLLRTMQPWRFTQDDVPDLTEGERGLIDAAFLAALREGGHDG